MPPPNSAGPLCPELLVIDHHDAVGAAHLVGVPALRQIDGRERARIARISYVHNGRAVRGLHVPDEHRGAVDPDLPAAGAVEVGHEAGIRSARHGTLDTME